MRILHAPHGSNAASRAHSEHGRPAIAFFVHGKNQGTVKRRQKKGIRGMAEMMLELDNFCSIYFVGMPQKAKVTQITRHTADLTDLAIRGRYWRERENSCARQGPAKPSLQRPTGHGHVVEIAPAYASAPQTELNGGIRQAARALRAQELAFFHRGANYAILQQRS